MVKDMRRFSQMLERDCVLHAELLCTHTHRALLSIQIHVPFPLREAIVQTDRKSALSVSEVHREVMSDGSRSEPCFCVRQMWFAVCEMYTFLCKKKKETHSSAHRACVGVILSGILFDEPMCVL